MTKTSTLSMPHLYRSTVGFERLFDELGRQFENSTHSGYPPYDVIQVNEDEYTVSLAVAGFSMDELSVTQEKNILRIEGMANKDGGDVQYQHRGIAKRNFAREFHLADHVDVVDAKLELGLLTVYLKREIPESEKPRQIGISTGNVGTTTKALDNDAE